MKWSLLVCSLSKQAVYFWTRSCVSNAKWSLHVGVRENLGFEDISCKMSALHQGVKIHIEFGSCSGWILDISVSISISSWAYTTWHQSKSICTSNAKDGFADDKLQWVQQAIWLRSLQLKVWARLELPLPQDSEKLKISASFSIWYCLLRPP